MRFLLTSASFLALMSLQVIGPTAHSSKAYQVVLPEQLLPVAPLILDSASFAALAVGLHVPFADQTGTLGRAQLSCPFGQRECSPALPRSHFAQREIRRERKWQRCCNGSSRSPYDHYERISGRAERLLGIPSHPSISAAHEPPDYVPKCVPPIHLWAKRGGPT
jgi:hypothetical protein